LQALGDGVQAAAADAVGDLLAFLDLPKGHCHRLAQRLMGNPPRYARRPYATAHVLVDGTGFAAFHNVPNGKRTRHFTEQRPIVQPHDGIIAEFSRED
jgi:hypothetical protein